MVMSDESSSDSIELKKRARRRLVGAAALALLAAIVLPLVMDSEPKTGGQEIQIRIPSKDGAPVVAAAIPVPGAPLPAQRETEKPGPDADTLAAEKPAVQDGPTDTAPKAKPADAAPKAKPEVAPKPEATKPDAPKKSDAARAEAILDGKDAAQWIVQLGAYQNAGNVKQLTTKLKEAGLPAYTEKFDSPQGARTRVRAGPFVSREAAEKARDRIKKLGVDGQVAQK